MFGHKAEESAENMKEELHISLGLLGESAIIYIL
jgi:hypothetical protein